MKISKFLLLFILLVPLNSIGQSSSAESDQLTPNVKEADGFLAAENFPAYSKKENAILVVHQSNSCCYSSGTFIWKVGLLNMAVLKKFMLCPPGDSVDLISLNKSKTINDVRQIVKEGSYQPREQIRKDNFAVTHPADNRLFSIDFWFVNGKARQLMLELPDFILPGECCTGGLATTEPCQDYPDSFDLWIDKSHKLLLLAYGVISQSNGCDAGPAYIAKRLARR